MKATLRPHTPAKGEPRLASRVIGWRVLSTGRMTAKAHVYVDNSQVPGVVWRLCALGGRVQEGDLRVLMPDDKTCTACTDIAWVAGLVEQ